MDREVLALPRLDRLIWGIVAMVAAAVVSAPAVSNFKIAWDTFAAPAAACVVLLAAGAFYSRWRADPRLASGLLSTAQVIAFAAVAAPLSYLAASANLPLCDHGLDAVDRALGLDWKGLLDWMNASPLTYAALRPIYLSLTLQMTTVVLCLAFSGRLLWLRIYTLAFICAALISIAVSAVLPAAGAWPYHGLGTSDSEILPAVRASWPVFYGLRDGTFRLLVAVGSEGIITFPSLHAALAVIVVAALWPVAVLRWVFLALNTAMLVATPIDGSHYFIDVAAGVALAALSLMVAQTVAVRAAAHLAPHPAEPAQGAEASLRSSAH
jgi:PAP2 superfamily